LYILNFNPYICTLIKKETMNSIGKITKEQIIKSRKKASREMEIEANAGWVATHKVHKSQKDYNRKPKHRNLEF